MSNYDEMSFEECMRSLDLLILKPKKKVKSLKKYSQKKSAPKLLVSIPIRYYHKYLAHKAKRRGFGNQREETRVKKSVLKKTQTQKGKKKISRKVRDLQGSKGDEPRPKYNNKTDRNYIKSYVTTNKVQEQKKRNNKDNVLKEAPKLLNICLSDIPMPADNPSPSKNSDDYESIGNINITFQTEETAPTQLKQSEKSPQTEIVIDSKNSRKDRKKKQNIFKNIKCEGNNAIKYKQKQNDKKRYDRKRDGQSKKNKTNSHDKVKESNKKGSDKNVTTSSDDIQEAEIDRGTTINTDIDEEPNEWQNPLSRAVFRMLGQCSGLERTIIKTFNNGVRLTRQSKDNNDTNKELALLSKKFLKKMYGKLFEFIKHNAEHLTNVSQIIKLEKAQRDGNIEIMSRKRQSTDSNIKASDSAKKRKRQKAKERSPEKSPSKITVKQQTVSTQTQMYPQSTTMFFGQNFLPRSNQHQFYVVPHRSLIPNICFERASYEFHKNDPRFSRYLDPEYRRNSTENSSNQVKPQNPLWGRHYDKGDNLHRQQQIQKTGHIVKTCNLIATTSISQNTSMHSTTLEQQKDIQNTTSNCTKCSRNYPKR